MIAGLAVYANSEEGKKGKLLEELARIGKDHLPRHSKGKSKGINIDVSRATSQISTKTKAE